MIYTLRIFKKDRRYRSQLRLCGSYTFERENKEAMEREVRELNQLYRSEDGYMFVVE